MKETNPPLAVSPEEAVKLFPCLNVGTLANDRSKRRGCRFYRLGRKIVYRVADLEQYVFGSPVQTVEPHDCGCQAGGCHCHE